MRIRENSKGFVVTRSVLLVVAVILLAVGGWYIYRNTHKSTANSMEAGWTTYQNQKYGIEFSYPKQWGEPTLRELSDIPGLTGKRYQVVFGVTQSTAKADRKLSISISMDSNNESFHGCDQSGNCRDIPGFSKSAIQKVLGSKVGPKYTMTDKTSYAIVSSFSEQKTSTMNIAQIVNVPKINVSAVQLFYNVTGATGCPPSGFAQNGSKGCITQPIYETASKVIKSIKSLDSSKVS